MMLAAKRDIIALKAEIHKLVNIPTGLNNLKTKTSDLDVDNLKNVQFNSINLKKISDVVSKEVVIKLNLIN